MTWAGAAVRVVLAVLAVVAITGGLVLGAPAGDTEPPATLLSGEVAIGSALDPVFAHLKLDRLSCKFTEEKRVALLARPLHSTGTIYFERDKGIARRTVTPKVQQVVLTKTMLRVRTGKKTEEIALDKSKDLKAFALILPTLLHGDRAELQRAFDISLYGSDKDWWALALNPKTDSLKKLVRRVIVFGRKGNLVSLRVIEASGDTTDTRFTNIQTNADVPDTEIATAFGAP